MRRLSIAFALALVAVAGSGCIVANSTPDEGASATPTAQRATESVPLSAGGGTGVQQPTPVAPQGDYQLMDTTGHDPSHDPPPPRPWQPGPQAASLNGVANDSTQKPSIGGAKDDDGSKPTK